MNTKQIEETPKQVANYVNLTHNIKHKHNKHKRKINFKNKFYEDNFLEFKFSVCS